MTETQAPDPAPEPLGYLSEHTGPEGPFKWQFTKTLAGVYRDTALRVIPVYEPAIPAPEGAQAVMRQALEALEIIAAQDRSEGFESGRTTVSAITALRAALAAPAPQAPVPLPDVDLCRLISSHEVHQYHPGALHEFSHAVIAEFCRVNGIPAPQTKEPKA